MVKEQYFNYLVEQFADIRILRFRIPGFEDLPLKKKLFLYYLSQAALSGRDILWDQNNANNLWLREVLTSLYHANVNRLSNDIAFTKFVTYFKQILFSNGFHHHYSTDKLRPSFSQQDIDLWIDGLSDDAILLLDCKGKQDLKSRLYALLFDDSFHSKRVSQEDGVDLVSTSCNNFYRNVTQKEAEGFYNKQSQNDDEQPVSHGLNSRLEKVDGTLVEKIWKVGGEYSNAIVEIIGWLEKAKAVAENQKQVEYIDLLCDFYRTGDLKIFDAYSIAWLQEQEGDIDFINGFIEVYGDSLGFKATWESVVNIKDAEATKHATIVSDNAQWFENHSPVESRFRKKEVKGVSMKVINAVALGGDCYPASPLGINLPNAEWIREQVGSKSVSLQNISYAHQKASLGAGVLEEFALTDEEIQLHKKYGGQADNLHTHLHECLGHGSGVMLPGVKQDDLKAYGSVIEEARADLYGLFFMADDKMLELGLVPDMEMYKAQYNAYIRNGLLVQMARIKKGNHIEQAHMRNRQLICKWVFEKGQPDGVIEQVVDNGKTYFVVRKHSALRELFGQLLNEIQRIKSTGDVTTAQQLVETYGVKVDPLLHADVLKRYMALNVAPYTGFINPIFTPFLNQENDIEDIKLDYTEGFLEQMLRYGNCYSYK